MQENPEQDVDPQTGVPSTGLPRSEPTPARTGGPAPGRGGQRRGSHVGAAVVTVAVGLLFMFLGFMQGVVLHQPFPGMVIGDYEVVTVFGIILVNLGVLVFIQEWSGVS